MYILPLSQSGTTLQQAGGKAINLTRLILAGFNVPPGFVLQTTAYKTFVNANNLQAQIDLSMASIHPGDPDSLEAASIKIRNAFTQAIMPAEIETELEALYSNFMDTPVAIRSSATTEDLPDLSFAGQQDTYLNVMGQKELRQAVINCWSSLWTARAIGYRTRNAVPNTAISLAIIIQKMVPAECSGVLFTANPLTGLLNETVIDATYGLGETLVSGQVEPDHFVVDSSNGELKRVGIGSKLYSTHGKPGGGLELRTETIQKTQSISKTTIQELAAIGQAVQNAFGSPQDIEWALVNHSLYILQTRPITSLFPVPEISFSPLILWFSFGTVQGLMGPMTPLGIDTILYLVAKAGNMFGLTLKRDEIHVLTAAGERIWIRISDVIRNPLGNHILDFFLDYIEPSVGQIIKQIAGEPAVGAGKGTLKFSTLRALAFFALPMMVQIIHNLIDPENARAHFDKQIDDYLANARIPPSTDRFTRLAAIVAFMRDRIANAFRFLLPKFIPIMGPSMAGLNLLIHFSQDPNLAFKVTRGLPHNVTTEMDIKLWDTAAAIQNNQQTADYFKTQDPSILAEQYLNNELPEPAQAAIQLFMREYGMRGVGEIDFGQQRWREQPTPVMHTLQSYLQANTENAPNVMFAKGEQIAMQTIETIANKVRTQPAGWLKEKLVRAAARRVRLLMGARESPKFFAIRTMGIARKALLEIGPQFVEAGTLDQPEDLVYLTLDELSALAAESDVKQPPARVWKELVAERKAGFKREQNRRQVPRVLISDGRAMYAGLGAETATNSVISGSPVSPGLVEGIVHVVLDPRSAHLAQGEILVCPGTDPGWTPLFMIAGGLITEVGGMMTHGSVVAREYGIPAVVGVDQATQRLKTGQKIKMDGSTGKILIIPAREED